MAARPSGPPLLPLLPLLALAALVGRGACNGGRKAPGTSSGRAAAAAAAAGAATEAGAAPPTAASAARPRPSSSGGGGAAAAALLGARGEGQGDEDKMMWPVSQSQDVLPGAAVASTRATRAAARAAANATAAGPLGPGGGDSGPPREDSPAGGALEHPPPAGLQQLGGRVATGGTENADLICFKGKGASYEDNGWYKHKIECAFYCPHICEKSTKYTISWIGNVKNTVSRCIPSAKAAWPNAHACQCLHAPDASKFKHHRLPEDGLTRWECQLWCGSDYCAKTIGMAECGCAWATPKLNS